MCYFNRNPRIGLISKNQFQMSDSSSSYDSSSSDDSSYYSTTTSTDKPIKKKEEPKKSEPVKKPAKKSSSDSDSSSYESYSDSYTDSDSGDKTTSTSMDKSSTVEEEKPVKKTPEPPKPEPKPVKPAKKESSSYSDSDSDSELTTSSSSEEKKKPEPPAPKVEKKEVPPPKPVEKKKESSDSDSESTTSSSSAEKKKEAPPPKVEKKEAPPKPAEKKKKAPPPKPAEKKKESSDSDSESTTTPSEKPAPKPAPKKVESSDSETSTSSTTTTTTTSSSEKPKKKEEPKKEDKKKDDKKEKNEPQAAVATPVDPPDITVPEDIAEAARKAKTDRWGWTITEKPSKHEKELQEKELAKEKEREKKWKDMMRSNNWSRFMQRRGFRKVKTRTLKGIPDSCRARAWKLLLERGEKKKKDKKKENVQAFYDRGIPATDHTIRVDIPRTMPHVPKFADSEIRMSLYRILRAYNNADADLGYFQGMGFNAALFLKYMNEEDSFWCLYNLMRGKEHMVRNYFANQFSGLKKINTLWEILLEKKFKNVAAKLKQLGIDPMVYTPSWFLCAFLNLDFPPQMVLMIMDRFIVFGTRTLLSLGLAVIDLNQGAFEGKAGIETILPLLQNPTTAKSMKDWRLVIQKWNKYYLTKKQYWALFKEAEMKEFP
ncbi:hypothetical protein TRFO_07592 [Tritrichomonas foetus]|uniref:Rab-GAP TBC domain-containing protein n=1 Tax=Tritrichomonas foetus TaxID=1144522 RepID=A0A1J4JQP4_9EUKA|nr:hypothetical protein TRFO_07592 [Tritrichomonas foetus]|eukprot:OHT01355.1 hypothetical protein TRFO_07592 [Tritrichomonas foetus]